MAKSGRVSGLRTFVGLVLIGGSLAACGDNSTNVMPVSGSGTGALGPRQGALPLRPVTPTPAATGPTYTPPTRVTDPTIAGVAAASVAVGQTYSFKPTASIAGNEVLTFTIANKPSWASFNSTTGLLTGTPTASNIGAYPNIEIAVTDGSSVAALPAFAITVAPASSTGAVTLSWDAPTENSNGTPLMNLEGYKVYYGQQANDLTSVIDISTSGVTNYVVQNLAVGTYYFAVASYNSAGVESSLSTEVSTTVD